MSETYNSPFLHKHASLHLVQYGRGSSMYAPWKYVFPISTKCEAHLIRAFLFKKNQTFVTLLELNSIRLHR